MASYFIPLSGLESDSMALNTIANDLSNMNTTAFKDQSTNFSDLFYQQIGSSGIGRSDSGRSRHPCGGESKLPFPKAPSTSTGNDTDVALNGNGFFIVNNGGSNEYTRDGNFSPGFERQPGYAGWLGCDGLSGRWRCGEYDLHP